MSKIQNSLDPTFVESAKEIFQIIDRDRDELISIEELQLYFKILGHSFSYEDIQKLVEDANPWNSGLLSKKFSFQNNILYLSLFIN